MSTDNLTPAPQPVPAPKQKKKKWPLVVGAAVVVGVLAASCGGGDKEEASQSSAQSSQSQAEAPKAEAPKAEPAIGVPFTINQGSGNVAKVTILSATEQAELPGPYPTPAKSGTYLVLDVLWETESGVSKANPLYFNVKNGDGRKADVSFMADGQLGSGDVPVGDKMRGTIVFDTTPGKNTITVTDVMLQEKARLSVG